MARLKVALVCMPFNSCMTPSIQLGLLKPALERRGLEACTLHLNLELARMEDHLHRLRNLLAPIATSGQYDVMLIDCPPSLALLTLNAFAAADGLLVPLQCEYYALEGVSMLTRVLEQLRSNGVNPNLHLIGIVMTMFDGRTNLANQVVAEVRQHFGDLVFDTLIPRTTRLAEAPSFGKPIMHYDKYSAGAAAYEVLSNELLARLEPARA